MSLGFKWEVFVVKSSDSISMNGMKRSGCSKNRAARPLFNGGTSKRMNRYD